MHAPCYGASHNAARDQTGLGAHLPVGRSHLTELWLTNLNEFPGVADSLLRPPGLSHRVIASWFWELPMVLEPYRSHITRVDEIWVGSPFVRDTLAQYTTAPIIVVPVPIQLDVSIELERRDFGLSDDDVIFFYDFDANSTAARKNPFGLIAAFSQAFPDRPGTRGGPRLVLKGTNLHGHQALRSALEQTLAPIGGVLVDAELSRPEMNALLAMSDVYVSLHRAEGFGLGMAEAMYLGKPVVATVYPQLWTFPTAAAACPVRGRLRAITDADHAHFPAGASVYRPGLVWVEPDTAHAAQWISLLYEHPELRRRVGTAGARLVREHYSVEAARTVMLERLRIGIASPSHPGVEHGAVGDRLVSQR
jgi:glycosyltransferase involved in cell wall biosynthesis